MEHLIAALFTIGLLASHPHPPPAAPQVEQVSLQVAAHPIDSRLQRRDLRILAINAWMRELRGGHTHPPTTFAQRARMPNS